MQNGPDQSQVEAGTLVIPANQVSAFINAMASGLKQIGEQMKARAEAQAEAESDKGRNEVQ